MWYDVFEVTGFTELLHVQKRLREVSIDGCAQLGSGANGKVYRLTRDEMIKVFRPGMTLDEIEAEREASRKTFLMGVPCAIPFDTVKVDECYGTIYEMLNAATVQERIREKPDRLPELAAATAKLLKELHTTMQYLTCAMAHPRLPKEYHPAFADKVRNQVLSRYDELLGSLADALED